MRTTTIEHLAEHIPSPMYHHPHSIAPLLSSNEHVLWHIPSEHRRVRLHCCRVPGRDHSPTSNKTWNGMVCPQHGGVTKTQSNNWVHGPHSTPHYSPSNQLDSTAIQRHWHSTRYPVAPSPAPYHTNESNSSYGRNGNMSLLWNGRHLSW